MIGKLLCALPKWIGGGHRRGKRVGQATTNLGSTFNDFQCPRCTSMWTRKVRKTKAPA